MPLRDYLYYVLCLEYTTISCSEELKELIQCSLGVLDAETMYYML